MFKSEELLKQIGKSLENESLKKELIKKTNSKIGFNLKNKKGQTKSWLLDLKESGNLKIVNKGELNSADLIINISDIDFKKLVLGEKKAQQLFMSGKLKVRGDVMKAANIESVLIKLRPKAKL